MKQLVSKVVDRKARCRQGSGKEHDFSELSAAAAGLQQISWDGEDEGSGELSGGPTLPVGARACCERLRNPTLTWARLSRSGHAADDAPKSPVEYQGEIEEEIDGCYGASASPLPSPPREVEVLAACD